MKVSSLGNVRPPVHRVARDAKNAEEHGYDSLFFADHLMGWFPDSVWNPAHSSAAKARPNAHDYIDPTCAIMAAAADTSRIRLALGVTDLLRTHPAMVARTALTLDMFSKGRFILGVGSGEAENLLPYGVSMRSAVSRLEEGLEIVRLLWQSDGPVSLAGGHWDVNDAMLGLAAAYERRPPIWVAARGARMRSIAARLGDGWLPMFMSPTEYESALADISAERERLRLEEPMEAAYYTFVAVGDSREACLQMFESPVFKCLGLLLPEAAYDARGLEHPLGSGKYGLVDFVPTRLDGPTAKKILDRVPPEVVGEAIMHGSPDDIEEDLRSYARAGCEHVALANVSFLTDVSLARPSYGALNELVAAAARISASGGPAE